MNKFFQRTYLALKHNAEFHTNTVGWRSNYKQLESPCNSEAMMMEWHTSKRFKSKFTTGESKPPAGPLGDIKAYDLVMALSDSERLALKNALEKYDAQKLKEGFEDFASKYDKIIKCEVVDDIKKEIFMIRLWKETWKLAATQWRTRFGRLSKIPPPLSNVDPTGSFCAFPEDWLKKKAEERAVPPTTSDLYKLFIVNAVPFIAFGFLDNFCMIVAGDYIEHLVGTVMCISTMAAAGLGNTVSDIVGIGSAFYVERLCTILGLRPPDLVAIQMEMKESRRASNLGRIIGITLGCILGMFPILFLRSDEKASKKKELAKQKESKS